MAKGSSRVADPSRALPDGELVVPPGPPRRLDRALRDAHRDTSWSAVRKAIATGKVSVAGAIVRDAATEVAARALVVVARARPRLPRVDWLGPDPFVYGDAQILVVRKPAGVSTVHHESDPGPSLLELLHDRLRQPGRRSPKLGVVQRLDRETSGILVFARTARARQRLAWQLRQHTVARAYLALAVGEVGAATLRSRLVRDRGDGRRGSTDHPKLGRESVTHVEPLERFAGATLVRCRLETGRTHQIRIHLSEAGHPLFGERAYRRRGDAEPPVAAPRLMLHAATLGFHHPEDERWLDFDEPMPADMTAVLAELRRRFSR